MAEKLHDAFISYSRKDRAFASLLEKALESLSPPKIGNIPLKHLDIFRDEEDFTGTDYHKAVSKHLQDSRKLIVICTPAARASQYVNDEIRVFAKTNGSEHIIPILLDGLPNNEANEQQEANKAFPDALVNCMQMPLAIDYRDFRIESDSVDKKKFASVWFSLLANLYGIGRSEIEQRERKRQRRILYQWIGGFSLVISILLVFLLQTREARDAEQQAKEKAFEQRDKAQHALAVSEFREAQRHFENGNLTHALAHLAKAVRLDESWLPSRTLLINLLQQRNWHLPELAFKHRDHFESHKFDIEKAEVNQIKITLQGYPFELKGFNLEKEMALYSNFWDKNQITSATFNSDGTRVVTTFLNSNVARIWNVKTGKEQGDALQHDGEVWSAVFSADGTRVVTASSDNTARVWDAQTGKAVSEVMQHEGPVASAAFSPDGTRVVTASKDQTARVWDGQTGKALSEVMQHEGPVVSAEFSPDGSRVVTASWDKTAQVWDVKTSQMQGEPMQHIARVDLAVFNADGTRVVTASRDNAVRVWDAQTGNAVSKVMPHSGLVVSAAFSSDGARVVTASQDSVRVWNAKTGQVLGKVMRHNDAVTSAKFSADGTRVATASMDGTARV